MEEKRLLNPDELHEECGVFGMYDFDGNDVAAPGAGELRYCGQ